jgi:hypothetical protein
MLPDNTVEAMLMESSGRPVSPTAGAVHPSTIAGIGTIGHSEMARYGTASPIGAFPEDHVLATTKLQLDKQTIHSLMQVPIGDFSVPPGKNLSGPMYDGNKLLRSPCSPSTKYFPREIGIDSGLEHKASYNASRPANSTFGLPDCMPNWRTKRPCPYGHRQDDRKRLPSPPAAHTHVTSHGPVAGRNFCGLEGGRPNHLAFAIPFTFDGEKSNEQMIVNGNALLTPLPGTHKGVSESAAFAPNHHPVLIVNYRAADVDNVNTPPLPALQFTQLTAIAGPPQRKILKIVEDSSPVHPEPQTNEQKKKDRKKPPLVKCFYEPINNDVLYGRGGGTYKFLGNQAFRKKIGENLAVYQELSNAQKQGFALDIVTWIHTKQHGKFLQYDEKQDGWFEVTDRSAAEKVKQAFREAKEKPANQMKNTR